MNASKLCNVRAATTTTICDFHPYFELGSALPPNFKLIWACSVHKASDRPNHIWASNHNAFSPINVKIVLRQWWHTTGMTKERR